MSLWVCSKWNERPTNSEKWEVLSEHDHGYKVVVPKPLALGTESWFPKSDYRPCDPPKPPERWEDVTAECTIHELYPCALSYKGTSSVTSLNGYRLRKVQLWKSEPNIHELVEQWAFIVEKKVAT